MMGEEVGRNGGGGGRGKTFPTSALHAMQLAGGPIGKEGVSGGRKWVTGASQ